MTTKRGTFALRADRRPQRSFFAYQVRGCGRCGKSHRRVLARRFRRPPEGWDAWALCPRTGEPLLLRLEVAGSGSADGPSSDGDGP